MILDGETVRLINSACIARSAGDVKCGNSGHELDDLHRAEVGMPVGSYVVSSGEFPWAVSVRCSDSHVGCGVLLNERAVLTTAFVADSCSAQSLEIQYGALRLDLPEVGYGRTMVSRLMVHPLHDSRTSAFDVAVLVTENVIPFGENTQPVRLAADGDDPPEGQAVQVAGWGAASEGGSLSRHLEAAQLMVADRSRAAYDGAAADTMIAAGVPGGGRGPSRGDEGGGLVTRDDDGIATVVGIYSRGPSETQDQECPALFARIGAVRSFIDEALTDLL